MVRIERDLIKQEKEGKIKDLKFGRSITVEVDDQGLYREKFME